MNVRLYSESLNAQRLLGNSTRVKVRARTTVQGCRRDRSYSDPLRSHVVQNKDQELSLTKRGPDSTLVAELGASHLLPLALAQG